MFAGSITPGKGASLHRLRRRLGVIAVLVGLVALGPGAASAQLPPVAVPTVIPEVRVEVPQVRVQTPEVRVASPQQPVATPQVRVQTPERPSVTAPRATPPAG